MKPILLKVKCKNLSRFMHGKLEIDFVTEKRISKDEIADHTVINLINSIYKFNTMALIGVNASGKTSTMRVLSSVLDIYLGNASLTPTASIMQYFNDVLELETYYYFAQEKQILKLVSTISKRDFDVVGYDDERLYAKKATNSINRGNLYDFEETDLTLDRANIKDTFLKKEDSIFSSIMNRVDHAHYIQDMCDANFNLLTTAYDPLLMNFVNYLDPTVSRFEIVRKEKQSATELPLARIAFHGSSQEYLLELIDLGKVLSSGTIKGIVFLSNIITVLKNGGYLLVDEIENHLNKTIIVNLIGLFNSDLNRNGATIVFSTHYSEIVDFVPRSDSIYILNNRQGIQINKFSHVAGPYDRIDKKKSDVILSGAVNSAPKYRAYTALIEALRGVVFKNETNH